MKIESANIEQICNPRKFSPAKFKRYGIQGNVGIKEHTVGLVQSYAKICKTALDNNIVNLINITHVGYVRENA